MADIDLKTETPDETLPSTGFVFGADSQSAASPSVYSVQALMTALTGSTGLNAATETTSKPLLNMTQTWNAAGVTFTGWKLNVTDTASASGSLLMDLQVGGASRFRVNKNGSFGGRDPIFGDFSISSAQARILLVPAAAGGVAQASINFNGIVSAVSAFHIGNADPANADVRLARDAANTLALRNSTNAQTLRAYNTYTDPSNFERGFMQWSSNVLKIGTEKAGTGTARALEFQTDGTTRLTIAALGAITTSGAFTSGGSIAMGASGVFSASTRSGLSSPSNGVWLMSINAGGDFDRLQFGGTTSSFPAIKRSSTTMQARLADDSDYASFQGKLTTETAYTAGAPTATGYLVLYDSGGTAYKVPAEAL